MKIKICILAVFVVLFMVGSANAASVLVFDSTDNYTGACQLTDKSEWTLTKDLDVDKFLVHQPRNVVVLKALMRHDMAPMTG